MFARIVLSLTCLLSLPALAAEPLEPPTLMKRVGPSVARVACRGQTGVGVVYRDRRHVLTAYGLVWSGRAVRVTFPDGTVIDGETVVADSESDVAVVRLESDAPAEPIALATERPALDALVSVIGRSHDGLPASGGGTPTLLRGRIAAIGDDYLRVDAHVGEGDLGAPVLDAEGRLIGVALGQGDGVAPMIPADKVAAVPVDDDPIFGEWYVAPSSGLMLGVSSDRTLTKGLYTGFRLVGGDALQLDLGVSILFDDDIPQDDETLIERDRVGFTADALAGYRFSLLPPELGPMHLTLSGGVSFQQFGGALRTLGADGRVTKIEIDETFVRPTVGVGLLLLGVIELKYLWDINTDDLGASGHRIGIGVSF